MAETAKKCIEIGKRIGNIENQMDLKNYIDKVFHVDTSCKYAEEYSCAVNEWEYDVYLQIEEISAEGLVRSKKPGRIRDPSCKLAVVTQENLNFAFPKSPKKDKHPKKGTSDVFQTEVKESTLEPQWNQLDAKICLPVPTSSNTFLLAEIWDNGANVKSLGRISVPLKGLSAEGVSEEVCNELPPWNGQPGGKIRLKFRLKVQIRDQSMVKIVEDYEKLLDVFCSRKADNSHSSLPSLKLSSSPCMSHLSSSTCTSSSPSINEAICKPVFNFCGELDPSAERILALCAEYFGISKLHQAFMKFNIAMKYSCVIGETIVGHLTTIVEHRDQWEDRLQLLNSEDCSELQKWEREQMHELLNNCESFHGKIKTSLSTSPTAIFQWNAERVKTFSCELRILELMYKIRVFREILPVEERDMKQVVNSLLQSSFREWTLQLQWVASSKDFSVHICYMVLKEVNNILKNVLEKLRASFTEVNIEFVKVVYLTVGEQINEHIPKDDSRYLKEPDEALRVFVMLKNFRDLPQLLHEYVDPAKQPVVNFHVHFAKVAPKWVITTADNLCNRIVKASSTLKEETVTNDDVFSVNSTDTVDLIVALCQFLDSTLQWPDPSEFIHLLELLLVKLSEAVVKFADNVQAALRSSGYCTPVGSEHFTVTKKLCIAMSDIEHIRLSVTREEISGYFQWYGADGKGFEDEKVEGILCKMDRDLLEIQNKLIEGIVVQMTPHIKECLKLSLKNRDDSYRQRLMDYLHANMKMCGKGLQESLLLRLLEPLWHSILNVMTTGEQKLSKEVGVCDTYHYGTLQMLHDFMWADGSGLRKDQIETEKYWALSNKLHFHTLSDKEVFQVYCMELANKQSNTFTAVDQPSLTVMAEYQESDSTVRVNLIKASDLPPVSHGHKPPRAYFKISAIPEVNFPEAMRMKSDVYEPSLNPVLDKEYSFPASREVLEDHGNIIMVEMYSHSQAKAHKPVGLAVLHCKEIPATRKNSSVLDPSKKLFELAILKPPRSPAFEELSKRSSCTEFVKHMKKLMQSHSL